MERTPYSPEVGWWWRLDRYEVRAGVIRPARNATLEWYDPWDAYRASRRRKGDAPPYASLRELVVRLDRARESEAQRAKRIAAWCGRHGLLGVLLHQTHAAHLAPRFGRNRARRSIEPEEAERLGDAVERHAAAILGVSERSNAARLFTAKIRGMLARDRATGTARLLVPMQRGFHRAKRGWTELTRFGHAPRGGLPQGIRPREGQLVRVPPRQVGLEEPGALWQPIGLREIEFRPLRETWAPFFPTGDAPDDYEYPSPLSDSFVRLYSEPVTEFLRAARLLRAAIESVPVLGQRPATAADNFKGRQREALVDSLFQATAVVIPGADGRPEMRWASPSLLASYTMMAVNDLTSDGEINVCTECKVPFVTRVARARYCGESCYNTAHMRRKREKRRRGSAAATAGP